jgi:hypothetical protein
LINVPAKPVEIQKLFSVMMPLDDARQAGIPSGSQSLTINLVLGVR